MALSRHVMNNGSRLGGAMSRAARDAGQFVNALPADRSIAHDQGIELSGMLDGIAAVGRDDVPACIDERVKTRDVADNIR